MMFKKGIGSHWKTKAYDKDINKLLFVFAFILLSASCKKSNSLPTFPKVTIADGGVSYTDSANGVAYVTYSASNDTMDLICLNNMQSYKNISFFLQFTAVYNADSGYYIIDTALTNSFVENFYTTTTGAYTGAYAISSGSATVKTDSTSFSFTALFQNAGVKSYKTITGDIIVK
jgi:hypothetical protein